MQSRLSLPRTTRRGFTLIELVVVLVILAIVAGMTVAIVDWIRRSANYASASHNQGSLAGNLQLFTTTKGRLPDGFDSLLSDDQSSIFPLMPAEFKNNVASVGALAGEEFATLQRAGLLTVYDHTDDLGDPAVTEGNPGNTAIGALVRPLNATSPVAIVDLGKSNGPALARAVFPKYNGALPPDAKLILLGVGPMNEANGSTMQSAPFYTAGDPKNEYNRFIALVAVYNPREGRRAQIKGILDSKGRPLNRQLSEYWQSTNPDD